MNLVNFDLNKERHSQSVSKNITLKKHQMAKLTQTNDYIKRILQFMQTKYYNNSTPLQRGCVTSKQYNLKSSQKKLCAQQSTLQKANNISLGMVTPDEFNNEQEPINSISSNTDQTIKDSAQETQSDRQTADTKQFTNSELLDCIYYLYSKLEKQDEQIFTRRNQMISTNEEIFLGNIFSKDDRNNLNQESFSSNYKRKLQQCRSKIEQLKRNNQELRIQNRTYEQQLRLKSQTITKLKEPLRTIRTEYVAIRREYVEIGQELQKTQKDYFRLSQTQIATKNKKNKQSQINSKDSIKQSLMQDSISSCSLQLLQKQRSQGITSKKSIEQQLMQDAVSSRSLQLPQKQRSQGITPKKLNSSRKQKFQQPNGKNVSENID